MSRLSILIPFVGTTQLLEETLLSVLENRPEQSEILVVLGRRYDDPYQLGDEVRFVQAPPRAGLVGCLNLGIGMSRAEIVHVLACGTEVTDGWADWALSHFGDPQVACVAPLVLDSRTPGRVIAAGSDYLRGGSLQWLRPAPSVAELPAEPMPVLGPHTAAAFYRKSALERVGCFEAEAGDRLALVDMALLLKHAGFEALSDPHCQVRLSPAARDRAGAFRRAWDAERLFWRWASVHGWGGSLASHVATLTTEGMRGALRPSLLPWMAGRLMGGLSIGSHRRCRRRLRQAAEAVSATGAHGAPHFAGDAARSPRDSHATVSRG